MLVRRPEPSRPQDTSSSERRSPCRNVKPFTSVTGAPQGRPVPRGAWTRPPAPVASPWACSARPTAWLSCRWLVHPPWQGPRRPTQKSRRKRHPAALHAAPAGDCHRTCGQEPPPTGPGRTQRQEAQRRERGPCHRESPRSPSPSPPRTRPRPFTSCSDGKAGAVASYVTSDTMSAAGTVRGFVSLVSQQGGGQAPAGSMAAELGKPQ